MCVLIDNAKKGSGCDDIVMIVKESDKEGEPKIILYNDAGEQEAEQILAAFGEKVQDPEQRARLHRKREDW